MDIKMDLVVTNIPENACKTIFEDFREKLRPRKFISKFCSTTDEIAITLRIWDIEYKLFHNLFSDFVTTLQNLFATVDIGGGYYFLGEEEVIDG